MEKTYSEYLQKCSRCGGCQAHCPLFYETGRETFVARGKIELLEKMQAGELTWTDKMAELFSTCLLCGACTENCSNGVKTDQLVRMARKDLVVRRGLPLIKKNIFQHLLAYNGRLNLAGKLLCFYQKTGLQKLVRSTGVLKLLPGEWASLESLLPTFPGRAFRSRVPYLNKVDNPRLRVAYFTGCATNLIFHNIGYSVLKVLRSQKVEVIVPDQWCCGVPAFVGGDFKTGKLLGERNIEQFRKLPVDYIICDCASCLSTWLEYPELLESEEALKIVPKVMDINRFLVEVLDIRFDPPPLGIKVTYHDPCHLKRTTNGRSSPRELLKRLSPGYEFVEMAFADRCCGSAGSFNLSHYLLSQKVAERKIGSILDSGADIVTSACPSCIMQLGHSLRKNNINAEAKHVIELVAKYCE